MARRPKVALVSHSINHGLPYQRLHIALRHLKDEFDFSCHDVDDFRHTDAFYSDAIVLCHPWTMNDRYLTERSRLHYGVPVIVDIDDLITHVSPDHPEYSTYKAHGMQHQAAIAQNADYCVYSTNYIANLFAHLNKNFKVIENSISAETWEKFKPVNKPHKNAFTVMWTGGQSHRSDQYATFLEGLKKFLREEPHAKAYFHVLCPDQLFREFGSQVIFESNPCYFLDYPGLAQSYPGDVCLVGLDDTVFNNGKSDLKLLELAPSGIPLIASPRSDFIQHKDKGIMLYAEDNSEFKSWYDQIRWCFENQDELKAIGQRARDYVFAERTSDKVAAKWREVLNACIK
jgi:glycosyltransferase involved in cell wall biosynthesis